MEKLLDFYRRILESVGFKYNDNGTIYRVLSNDKEVPAMVDGKPLVLPTKNHLDTLIELDEKNQPCINKVLFNPLNEDMIKGDSHSLTKLKECITGILNHSIFTSCMLLMHVGKDKDLQDEATILVTEYLSSLSEIDRGANVKRLIDDETINHWEKIYDKMLEDGFKTHNIINIFIKKRGRDSKGEMSNRLTTINSSLLGDLETLKEEKSPVYLDVKLRTKDVKVYITTLNFLLDNLDIKTNTLSIGSCDNLAPAFVSLFSTYLKFIEKPNQILKDLRYVNYDYSDSGYKEIKVTMDEILDVSKYKTTLHSIPNDIEAHRMANQHNQTAQQNVAINGAVAQPVNPPIVPSTDNPVQDYINNKRQRMGYPTGYQQPIYGTPQIQQPPVYQPPMVQQQYQQPQLFVPQQPMVYQQLVYPNQFNQPVQQIPMQGYIPPQNVPIAATGNLYR